MNDGYRLVNNAQYPRIAEDSGRAFQVSRALPCEMFLAAHDSQFQLLAKSQRFIAGGSTAFIDPVGCARWLTDGERVFEAELARQRLPGPPSH